ncbi:MAG: hypothetical protein ACE5FN_05375 [Leptospirillia bacterium]
MSIDPAPYLSVSKLPEGAECARCFCDDMPLRPDPAIDDVWFCKACWEERIRVTAMHEMGYDNDIMEE